MMGQPGYAKNHNHHEDSLRSLEERGAMAECWRGNRSFLNTPVTSEEHSTVKHTPIAYVCTSMGSNKSVKFDLT